jgi:hypothetical protein
MIDWRANGLCVLCERCICLNFVWAPPVTLWIAIGRAGLSFFLFLCEPCTSCDWPCTLILIVTSLCLVKKPERTGQVPSYLLLKQGRRFLSHLSAILHSIQNPLVRYGSAQIFHVIGDIYAAGFLPRHRWTISVPTLGFEPPTRESCVINLTTRLLFRNSSLEVKFLTLDSRAGGSIPRAGEIRDIPAK